ncbi:MAG: UDP-3-O-[3-hydroxymyristoyl] glucosamine N-acyltransferase [Planctomycetota bacterium]
MTLDQIRAQIPADCTRLSVLREAGPGFITYYVGDRAEHVAHLSGGCVISRPGFAPAVDGVTFIAADDPQLAFYRLSEDYRVEFLDYPAMVPRVGPGIDPGARIHPDAVIPESCRVGPGCAIGAAVLGEGVRLEANVIVYSQVEIGAGTLIESGTVVGATGMMWIWDGPEKVYLEQLGGVSIGANCAIGSNISIVRGSANERTVIGEGTCMAHGTMIGHGCRIGPHSHFANNVSFGGGVTAGGGSFFGCGSTVSPGRRVAEGVVLGAGAVLAKDALEVGVYVGVPARRVGAVKESMTGVPRWNPGRDSNNG